MKIKNINPAFGDPVFFDSVEEMQSELIKLGYMPDDGLREGRDYEEVKERFRIEDVQRATLNGRPVKLFKAFEFDQDAGAYVFCGQFEAPQNTPASQLERWIDHGGHNE